MAGYDRALYQLYLSKIPMFGKCTADQLDVVAELGEAVAAEAGQAVVTEGEVSDGFFVITSGRAKVARGGREIATLEPGDYFGELSLFDPAPRNSTISAVDTLSCVRMARADFTQALDKVPAIRDALLHGMARRIHELDQRV